MSAHGLPLLYSCTVGEHGPGRIHKPKRRRTTYTADIHCHILTPECVPLVKDLFTPQQDSFSFFASPETQEINQRLFSTLVPKLTLPAERLKDMDQMGIDVQVISPSPTQYYYWTDGELGPQLARMQNDRIAEIVRAYPTRFA